MLIAGGSANNAGNAGVLYLNDGYSADSRNRSISARLAVDLCVFGKLTLAVLVQTCTANKKRSISHSIVLN